jgi:hypothetical protein
MKRLAASGEVYFTSSKNEVIVIDNRIYSFAAGEDTIVESKHEERIREILKDGADESSPSDVTPRQYRRKSSEA